MIIFMHEDRAYLSWLARHRQGFVVDWLQNPTNKQPVLHRATCPEIKRSRGKTTHWTTGRHIKACDMDVDKLRDWVSAGSDRALLVCPLCQPQQAQAPEVLAAAAQLYPTAKALRLLPAFQTLSDRQIEAELKRLAP